MSFDPTLVHTKPSQSEHELGSFKSQCTAEDPHEVVVMFWTGWMVGPRVESGAGKFFFFGISNSPMTITVMGIRMANTHRAISCFFIFLLTSTLYTVAQGTHSFFFSNKSKFIFTLNHTNRKRNHSNFHNTLHL